MDRVRAILAALPSAILAIGALLLAYAGAQRTENRWAAWEWVIVGTVFLLSAIARYSDRLEHISAAHRLSVGHCPACGYDLRATPNRCPECGRVLKKPDRRSFV